MGFIVFLFVVAIALSTLVVYVISKGAGARLTVGTDTLKSILRTGWSSVARTYYQDFVPAVRKLRLLVVGMLVFGALYPWLIRLFDVEQPSTNGALVLCLVNVVGAVFVYFAGRQKYFASGTVKVPAGSKSVDITYQATQSPPVVEVVPCDKNMRGYRIKAVTSSQFRLKLSKLAPAPNGADFRWTVQESKGFKPVTNVIISSFWAALVVGVVAFLVGLAESVEPGKSGSRAILLLSMPYVAIAFALFFEVWDFFAWLLALMVDILEFLPNRVYSLATAFMTKKWDKIEEILKRNARSETQAVNLISQEEFRRRQRQTKWAVIAALDILYMTAFLVPDWIGVSVMCLLMGLSEGIQVFHWYYINKALDDISRGIDRAAELKKYRDRLYAIHWRSLVTVSTLATILSFLVVAIMMFPGLDPKIRAVYAEIGACLLRFGDALKGKIFLILQMVVAIVGLYAVWPKNPEVKLARFRKLLAIPLGVLALVCVGRIIWTVYGDDATNVAKAATNGVLMRFTPTCTSTEDGILIEWPDYPGSNGYRIKRRELQDTHYTLLPQVFTSGANKWKDSDSSLKQGRTYFYRVVALGAGSDGKDIASDEREVVFKKPSSKPPASSSASPSSPPPISPPPAATTRRSGGRLAVCKGASCSPDPDLAVLCSRYPAACAAP